MKLLKLLLRVSLGWLIVGCSAMGGAGRFVPGTALVQGSVPNAKGGPKVTSTKDSGSGSLRDAVNSAKAGQTITFSLKKHAKITLKNGAIAITKNLIIAGPGASALTISGNGKSQIFTIASRAKVTISGLSIIKGKAAMGGAISNAGALKLASDTFSGNQTKGTARATAPRVPQLRFDVRSNSHGRRPSKAPHALKIARPSVTVSEAGGAIYNTGSLTITKCTLANNSVQQAMGGAIFNADGAKLTVSHSTFAKNEGALGGAIYNSGVAALTDDTFKLNSGWPGSGAPIAGGFGYGSAIYVDGNTTISTGVFSNNVAGGESEGSAGVGGAIAQYSGTLSVSNSTFTANIAGGGSHGSWGTGGAIYSTSGGLDLTGNTFSSNQAGGDADGYGGAVYADEAISGTGNKFTSNVSFGSASDGYSYGGAVYAGNGIALSGDVFTSNAASSGASGSSFGGALDSESTANLTTVTFNGNNATAESGGSAEGGAVYLGGGSGKWTSVSLSSNKAVSAGSGSYAAGGAAVTFAQLTVLGTTTVSANAAVASTSATVAAQGGGFAIVVGPFSFAGSVTGNTATTQGGGFWIDDTASITNSTLSGNKVLAVQNPNDGGGGIYVSLGGTLTLTKSTLTGNATVGSAASSGGGAIFNAGDGTLSNVTLAKNASSRDGGGIENDSVGTFRLVNVTMYQNVASGSGGNLKNLYSDARMTFANSIIGGGIAGTGPDISNDGAITSDDYNLIQTAVAGTALAGTTTHDLSGDPKLASLANNGGPTPTNADSSSSPGTAYIPYTVCQTVGMTVDQRNYPRNPKGLGKCDIGAYENQSP